MFNGKTPGEGDYLLESTPSPLMQVIGISTHERGAGVALLTVLQPVGYCDPLDRE